MSNNTLLNNKKTKVVGVGRIGHGKLLVEGDHVKATDIQIQGTQEVTRQLIPGNKVLELVSLGSVILQIGNLVGDDLDTLSGYEGDIELEFEDDSFIPQDVALDSTGNWLLHKCQVETFQVTKSREQIPMALNIQIHAYNIATDFVTSTTTTT